MAAVSTSELLDAVRSLREQLDRELRLVSTGNAPTVVITEEGGEEPGSPGNSGEDIISSCETSTSAAVCTATPSVRPQVLRMAVEYPTGDVYQGDVLLPGRLRHGMGRHACSGGDVYDGQWEHDKRSGTGTLRRANGFTYTGSWQDDNADGHGRAVYEEGHRYDGEWRGGRRCGWGEFHSASGDSYEGEWDDDAVHGQGRWTFPGGDYFEGRYAHGTRAEGAHVSADGRQTYTGSFQENLRHGEGLLVVARSYRFRGAWKRDVRNGYGECQYVDGSAYQGAWQRDVRHGRGMLSSPGGLRYEGDWKDDKQHGRGRCSYPNGDQYEGEWRDGVRHGEGCCVYGDGAKYQGAWAGDQRCGQGACIFPNGDKYQGEWSDDRRHGMGAALFSDGRLFRGQWDKGEWVQSEADPQLCRLAGPGLQRAVAGHTAIVMIEARDELRNRRLSGGDTFRLRLAYTGEHQRDSRRDGDVAGSVTDLSDGMYRGSYTATLAGAYELHITAGPEDEAVGESPYLVRVAAARAAVRHCTLQGEGRHHAVVGMQTSFTVQARDKFGNACEAGCLPRDLPLTVVLTDGKQDVPVLISVASSGDARDSTAPEAAAGGSAAAAEVVSDLCSTGSANQGGSSGGSSCYVCMYTAPQAGLYRLHVTSGDTHLRSSPLALQVTDSTGKVPQPPAGPVDQSQRWLQRAAAQFAAEDGSTSGYHSGDDNGDAPQTRQRRRHGETAAEDAYVLAHPGVAVVEQLEDLWKVNKLRNERAKATAETC